jgi:hypothetical protein
VLDAYRHAVGRVASDIGLNRDQGAAARHLFSVGASSVPDYIEKSHPRDDLAGYHAAARSEQRVSRASRAREQIKPAKPQEPVGLAPRLGSLIPAERKQMRTEFAGGQAAAEQQYAREKRSYRRSKRAYRGFERAGLATQAGVGRQLEAAQNAAHGEASAKPKEHHRVFGVSKAGGIPIPRLDWTAGRVLDFASRPLYAEANTVLAAQQGKPLGRAALRGLKGKDKTTFGDVLRAKGTTGKRAALLGLAGDVVFDPLNLVTVGRKTPATVLESLARRAEEASTAAREAGDARALSRRSCRVWAGRSTRASVRAA